LGRRVRRGERGDPAVVDRLDELVAMITVLAVPSALVIAANVSCLPALSRIDRQPTTMLAPGGPVLST